jgi:hypothetical protein
MIIEFRRFLMFFALLVFIAAFLLEGIGTYISTVGLSLIFASSPIIIALAVVLDFAKVITVSFLYKYFDKVNLVMKSYMTIAAMVLMIITSAGAFGFMSAAFQQSISGTNQDSVLLQSMTDEQVKLQSRKEEIDKQIANLPSNTVRGRATLMKQFAPEVDKINSRLLEIDKQLPELKVSSIKKNVEVGPIIYIAQAFNTDPEHAVKYVILIIIFVFDPLAIALLIAGNFLLALKKDEPIPVEPLLPVEKVIKSPIDKIPEAEQEIKVDKNLDINLPEITYYDTPDDKVPFHMPEIQPEYVDPHQELKSLDRDSLHQSLGRERFKELVKVDDITLEQLQPTKSSLDTLQPYKEPFFNREQGGMIRYPKV